MHAIHSWFDVRGTLWVADNNQLTFSDKQYDVHGNYTYQWCGRYDHAKDVISVRGLKGHTHLPLIIKQKLNKKYPTALMVIFKQGKFYDILI